MNENKKLEKLEFVTTACTVSSGDLSYQIWDYENIDNCDPISWIKFTRYDVTDAFARYSYTGFQFELNDDESSNELQKTTLSCTVKVCHEDDDNSVCKAGCYGL